MAGRPVLDGSAPGVAVWRDLARHGRLRATVGAATPEDRAVLSGAAYTLVFPVVFARATRGFEVQRGHLDCASSVHRLRSDCLDRFQDDVESVVEYVLAADQLIVSLEAWVAARITAATVDAHRRERGRRGALQRPRPPKWLSTALHQDAWLIELAIHVLTWVGISATAGYGDWPLDGWALRRAEVTGDWSGGDSSAVERDLETVLAVMRRRPTWYADYVERPFGHKRIPVAPGMSSDGGGTEPPALPLAYRHEIDDNHLITLATDAITTIKRRMRRGDAADAAIVNVITTIFVSSVGVLDIDGFPHSTPAYDEWVSNLLRDPEQVKRMVRAIRDIVVDDSCDPSPRRR